MSNQHQQQQSSSSSSSLSSLLETKRQKDKEKKLKLIEKKKAEFVAYGDKILAYSDNIKTKYVHLKEHREKSKSIRVAISRNVTHHAQYDTDFKKRPSDRDYDVRMYTKMDNDLWKTDTLRDWFNTYADPDADTKYAYTLTPAQTGYMIPIKSQDP